MFKLLLLGVTMAQALAFGASASYTVPVPFELAPYATFELKNSSIELKNGILEISYFLPLELVQPSLHTKAIHLTGSVKNFPSHFEVSDYNGSYRGQCLLRKDGVTCLVAYDFTPDVNSVIAYIKAKYPKNEHGARSRIVHIFGGEAGGVVHFPFGSLFLRPLEASAFSDAQDALQK